MLGLCALDKGFIRMVEDAAEKAIEDTAKKAGKDAANKAIGDTAKKAVKKAGGDRSQGG